LAHCKKKIKKVGLGNRNRIISTPKNKRFKTATKEKSWKLDLGARS
jgi:hypothetical protein